MRFRFLIATAAGILVGTSIANSASPPIILSEGEDRPAFAFDLPRVKEAAEHGNALAQSQLGFTYYFGNGRCKRDYSLAASWWKRAAKQGRPAAERALGDAYDLGIGVTHNETEAFEWWSKAASAGEPLARSELAEAYRKGLYVPSNSAEKIQLENELAKHDIILREQAKKGWFSGIE